MKQKKFKVHLFSQSTHKEISTEIIECTGYAAALVDSIRFISNEIYVGKVEEVR